MPYKKIYLLLIPLILFAACEPEKPNQPILGIPALTTTAVTNITATSSTSGGNITDDGGFPVTVRGVCWSTSENPTIANEKSSDGTGTGTFSSSITGYSADITYYVRAYATNNNGTGYGNQEIFKYIPPNGTFIDTRDNHNYNWVKIGEQLWMAENLAYIPSVSPSSSGSETGQYFYVYGYEGTSVSAAKATANYTTYGVLYNWLAAMNGSSSSIANPSGVQGVCPGGWHLPSDVEWTELTDFLGGESVAGGKLKETGYDHWSIPNEGATNSSGFAALPGGYRYDYSGFYYFGYYGFLWSATELDATYARGRYLFYGKAYMNPYGDFKDYGFSVRCIRDN